MDKDIKTQAHIDSGILGFVFIDRDFLSTHNLLLHMLKPLRSEEVIDRREINSKIIEYLVRVPCRIHNYWEEISIFVTKLR